MRLVKSRRAGRLVFYALDDQHIIELLRQAHTHVEEPK
jgi:ArsR family transcriptional regulator